MMKRYRKGAEDKPTWASVPADVKREVEDALGSTVIEGRRIWGGYTPSATFKLTLRQGGMAFLKGVNSAGNRVMRRDFLKEMRLYRDLPALRPWAPRLLGTVEVADWHILLLEFVRDKRGVGPWTDRYARQGVEGLAQLHNAFANRELPQWVPLPNDWTGWRSLTEDADALLGLTTVAGGAGKDVSEWLDRFLPLLAELEAQSTRAGSPNTLLHGDVRSDNLLFRPDGRIAMVDWPSASRGAGLFDAVAFIQSVAAEGGPDPEQMLSWYDRATGRETPRDMLGAVLAGVSGYFASRAGLPDIPGLPRVRPWQRVQLISSLQWLCSVLKHPRPDWLSAVQIQASYQPSRRHSTHA